MEGVLTPPRHGAQHHPAESKGVQGWDTWLRLGGDCPGVGGGRHCSAGPRGCACHLATSGCLQAFPLDLLLHPVVTSLGLQWQDLMAYYGVQLCSCSLGGAWRCCAWQQCTLTKAAGARAQGPVPSQSSGRENLGCPHAQAWGIARGDPSPAQTVQMQSPQASVDTRMGSQR